MWHQAAADIEAVQLVQFIVGLDRSELENLIECSLNAGRLGIVKYETHEGQVAESRARRQATLCSLTAGACASEPVGSKNSNLLNDPDFMTEMLAN